VLARLYDDALPRFHVCNTQTPRTL